MKKLINKITNFVSKQITKATAKVSVKLMQLRAAFSRPKAILAGNSGEAYLDMVIKILLCVVLGALLLAGLYALFGDLVMPTLTRRIQEMFDYAG